MESISKIDLAFDIPVNEDENVEKLNAEYPDMIEPFKTTDDCIVDMLIAINEGICEVGDKGGWYLGDGIKVKVIIEYDEQCK